MTRRRSSRTSGRIEPVKCVHHKRAKHASVASRPLHRIFDVTLHRQQKRHEFNAAVGTRFVAARQAILQSPHERNSKSICVEMRE